MKTDSFGCSNTPSACCGVVYSYGEALAEDVCRPVYFYTRKGKVAWVRGNGREITAEMLDYLPRQEAGERLRAALDPSGNWLRDVLAEADRELTEKRAAGHTDAAGLVIAIDQPHARRIAALLKKITGEAPAIAISQESEASNTIKQFGRSGNPARWIVAVKMISEGVDIPRLRVGVYATTTQSALFFRQAVGRFVRVIPDLGEQSAVLFIPAVARLMEHALAIREEREHYLQTIGHLRRTKDQTRAAEGQLQHQANIASGREADGNNNNAQADNEKSLTPVSVAADDELENQNYNGENRDGDFDRNGGNANGGATGRGGAFSVIVPLYSEALPHDTIFNGMRFTPHELEQAATLGREFGIRLPAAQLAALIKHSSDKSIGEQNSDALSGAAADFSNSRSLSAPTINEQTFGNENQFTADNPLVTKTERKRRVREQINRQVNSLARRLGVEEREVHRLWLIEMNGSRQSEATEEELWRKLQWLSVRNEQFRQTGERASGQILQMRAGK